MNRLAISDKTSLGGSYNSVAGQLEQTTEL